jgi:colanic acid biosynthesis glycosyl transferase WcaI
VTGVTPRPPRVWFISELFWPEETSTGYFVTRIAEDVAAEYDVHAVCSQPTYSGRGTVAPRREVRNGVTIHRVRSTTLNKDVLLLRGANMLTFSLAAFAHVLRHIGRGDIVVAVTNPPVIPYLVRAAAALRGARFVLLVHDVYPEVLVATGMARSDAPHVRALHAASRRLYRGAERVVVLGRDMAELVSGKLQGEGSRPVIIPNWGDTDRVRPDAAAGAAVRRQLGLEDRFTVLYMGNMGRTHDVLTLLEAATLLRDDRRFHFLFVGWGAQRAALETETAQRGLANITVQGPCAADAMPGYLNAADVAVISFRRGMAGVSVPSRLYNVMAAGRPVLALADAGSELAQVVREDGIGWVIEPEAPEQAAALLRELAADPPSLEAAGRRARDAALLRYSRSAVAQEWLRLLRELQPSDAETLAARP